MKKKCSVACYWLGAVIIFLMMSSLAAGADKVVVIPLGGAVHDANLIPKNIKYDTEILGVLGNYPDPSCLSAERTACENWCENRFDEIPAETDERIACLNGCATMDSLYKTNCL